MLLNPFAPLQTFTVALLVQARHLFYGLAMLDRYKGLGWKKPLLIFGMCDETFSLNYTADIPEDVDRGWFMLFVTVLDWFYWVSGATIGGLIGNLIHFNTKGLSFVMTAMFVVIFLEQLKKEKHATTALIGLLCSGTCLWVFGPHAFLIPSMISILAVLLGLRKKIEKEDAQ